MTATRAPDDIGPGRFIAPLLEIDIAQQPVRGLQIGRGLGDLLQVGDDLPGSDGADWIMISECSRARSYLATSW